MGVGFRRLVLNWALGFWGRGGLRSVIRVGWIRVWNTGVYFSRGGRDWKSLRDRRGLEEVVGWEGGW